MTVYNCPAQLWNAHSRMPLWLDLTYFVQKQWGIFVFFLRMHLHSLAHYYQPPLNPKESGAEARHFGKHSLAGAIAGSSWTPRMSPLSEMKKAGISVLQQLDVFIINKGCKRTLHKVGCGKDNSQWRRHPTLMVVGNQLPLWRNGMRLRGRHQPTLPTI